MISSILIIDSISLVSIYVLAFKYRIKALHYEFCYTLTGDWVYSLVSNSDVTRRLNEMLNSIVKMLLKVFQLKLFTARYHNGMHDFKR